MFKVAQLVTKSSSSVQIFKFLAALDYLKHQGEDILEDDESRLSPLSHKHLNMLGHYSFTLAEQVVNGQLRPLKQTSELVGWS